MTEQTKPVVKSSQVWVNVIMGLAAFFPPVQEFLQSNPDAALWIVTGVNALWRVFITKTAIKGVL